MQNIKDGSASNRDWEPVRMLNPLKHSKRKKAISRAKCEEHHVETQLESSLKSIQHPCIKPYRKQTNMAQTTKCRHLVLGTGNQTVAQN